MIPKIDLADLSAEHRRFYSRALDSNYRRADIRDDDDRLLACALAEFGYGRAYLSDNGGTFTATPYLKAFTVARRAVADKNKAAYSYIEVEVLRRSTDTNGVLLAALFGATFDNKTASTAPWPTFTAQVRHDQARDSDHSLSILATLDIDHPVVESVTGHATTLVGTLTDARMWPTGTNITLIESNRGTPLDKPDMCTYGAACAKNPHPYGPYLPDERDDLDDLTGRIVRLTITPLSLVQDNGLHIDDRAITFGD